MSTKIARELVDALRKFTHIYKNKEYDITCSAPVIKQGINGKAYYSISIEMNPNDPLQATYENLGEFTSWFQAMFAKHNKLDVKFSSVEFLQIVLPSSTINKFQIEITPKDQTD